VVLSLAPGCREGEGKEKAGGWKKKKREAGGYKRHRGIGREKGERGCGMLNVFRERQGWLVERKGFASSLLW
jgi:hypothetical protein